LTQSGKNDDIHKQDSKQVSALEMLNREKHLVLLGDPGSGKSTFVNFVAWCLAGESLKNEFANIALLIQPLPDDEGKDKKEKQNWSHGPILPVRIILRDFIARAAPGMKETGCAKHLWAFIEQELADASLGDYSKHLDRELKENGGLILLDGLDEVPEANDRRVQLKQIIEDFKATFDKCRILVTSRTYAYEKQDFQISGMKPAVLAVFSSGQMRRFVDQWYDHLAERQYMNRDNARGNAQILKQAIFGNERIRELSERPLLLTLMASLHAWRGGSLPENREELYADAVDLLLDLWEQPKIVKDTDGNILHSEPGFMEWLNTDRSKMRQMLNSLAYQVHASQPELMGTADIPEKVLISEMIDLSEANRDIRYNLLVDFLTDRAGILISRGIKVYTFPHRTFQEYLSACYLTDEDFPEQIVPLAREDINRWREVVLLAGAKAARGSANNIWALAEELCQKDEPNNNIEDIWCAQLAGQALAETARLDRVSNRNQTKLDRVKQWLIHIIEGNHLPGSERALAGNSLARLGDPRDSVMTLDHIEFCYVPEGLFWMGSDDEADSWKFGNATPCHQVELSSYYISRYPVTVAQFSEFVSAGGYKEKRYWKEAIADKKWKSGQYDGYDKPDFDYPPFNLSNHPVVGVSWYEARAFTRWLTERWHTSGQLSKYEIIRLPTEAEWEKAARGGDDIPKNSVKVSCCQNSENPEMIKNPIPTRSYPWGNEIDNDKLNYEKSKIGATNSVGCFVSGAGPYGCEEMSGNVWEWCMDWYGEYSSEKVTDPRGPSKGSYRVFRGGSWADSALYCRSAFRDDWLPPGYRSQGLGFRLFRGQH
jgi:formylglycine-generating enzyme required for sulfatase activity/energy-coupling factor transporter ATP-binding protein EcfA2